MTREEANHKLGFLKESYQKLIDEKYHIDLLVGDGVRGEWEANTPLGKVYKDLVEALELAIKLLDPEPVVYGKWDTVHGTLSKHYICSACRKGSDYKTNYCPNCGAKMFEEQESEKYCDRNICLKNEYNDIGCDECEVTKSQGRK